MRTNQFFIPIEKTPPSRSVFKPEGVFYLSHLMGQFPRWLFNKNGTFRLSAPFAFLNAGVNINADIFGLLIFVHDIRFSV